MNLGLVARVLARVVKRVERLEVLDVCHGESLECLRTVGLAGLGVDW